MTNPNTMSPRLQTAWRLECEAHPVHGTALLALRGEGPSARKARRRLRRRIEASGVHS